MRARGRTILAVLGFLLVLAGGWAFLVAVVALVGIADGKYRDLTSAGWAYLFGGSAMIAAGILVLVRLHRRWRTAESYGPGLVVYAWSRRSLIGLNVVLTVGALFFLLIGVTGVIDGLRHLAAGHGGGLWTALLGVVGLSLAFSATTGWIRTVRRLDHQDPLFVVDDAGIECAQGRLAWFDIDRILLFTDVTGSGDSKRVERALAFVLRAGKSTRPVEHAYDDDAATTPFGLVIGITNCTTQAKAALAAYGQTPVKGELSELLPDGAELPDETEIQPLVIPGSQPATLQPPEPAAAPPYWPPPPGRSPSPEPSAAEGGLVPARRSVGRTIRNGVLAVLSLIMVLGGGLAILGSIIDLAGHNRNSGTGGPVASLVVGLALAGGGVLLMRRVLRKRKPAEAAEPEAEIASAGGTEA